MKTGPVERKSNGPRVLYLVYWGATEPLGQSLVIPAVKELARNGAAITLVTFEKPEDFAQSKEGSSIRVELAEAGIEWLPLKYHKQPKVPATILDLIQGIARSIVLRLTHGFDIIHARTFIGGLLGMSLAPALGARFVYHNEGFYPDEQVDAGVWSLNSAPHRIAKFLESRMYAQAHGIIALTHRAQTQIENLPTVKSHSTPVVVVPSCVDLSLFKPGVGLPPPAFEGFSVVYSGSVGGRYILDRIGRFVAVAANELKGLKLLVLSRAEQELVALLLKAGGLPDDMWTLKSVEYRSMPDRLGEAKAGLSWLRSGLSEHGGSPTKIGEYWAMGLPVITTPNIGDTDQVIQREKVGIVVRDHTEEAYLEATVELRELLKDPEVATRCRRAAEAHYALAPACERQMELYRALIGRKLSRRRFEDLAVKDDVKR